MRRINAESQKVAEQMDILIVDKFLKRELFFSLKILQQEAKSIQTLVCVCVCVCVFNVVLFCSLKM